MYVYLCTYTYTCVYAYMYVCIPIGKHTTGAADLRPSSFSVFFKSFLSLFIIFNLHFLIFLHFPGVELHQSVRGEVDFPCFPNMFLNHFHFSVFSCTPWVLGLAKVNAAKFIVHRQPNVVQPRLVERVFQRVVHSATKCMCVCVCVCTYAYLSVYIHTYIWFSSASCTLPPTYTYAYIRM